MTLNSPEILALMQTGDDEVMLRGVESENLRLGPDSGINAVAVVAVATRGETSRAGVRRLAT